MFLFLDLKSMIDDIRKKSKFLGIWGPALNFPMFLGPIVFYNNRTVWLIFACNLIAILIAAQIHKKKPFSRLTSICHLVWVPMIVVMFNEYPEVQVLTAYGIWFYYVATTVTISLFFDAFNLIKLATGDMSEIG